MRSNCFIDWLTGSRFIAFFGLVVAMAGCVASPPTNSRWHLQLAHDASGEIVDGSVARLIDSVRSGCDLRVAWGARRRVDPTRTIEHSATPLWISVRDSNTLSAQIGGFTPNLSVLGENPDEHPRFERFGGTETLVEWRADISIDGTFNAVWFRPHTGELIERVPQRHPMRWFADCEAGPSDPLFPPTES
ncbi:MAG: hypothetical protein AAGL69_17410 [Pseudomonadota bacterium]